MFAELGQDFAAGSCVLQEAVSALVTRQRNMSDTVDPQPRGLAMRYAAVEQIDGRRDAGKNRIERFIEQLEPRHVGVAHIDDDACPFRLLDPGQANRVP